MAPAPTPDDTRRAGAILLAVSSDTLETSGIDPCWVPVAGVPLLAWSVATFERAPEIAHSVLVVAPDRLSDAAALAAAQGWHRTQTVAAPAPYLRDLLRRALDDFSSDITWIVVHDAARPLITPELIAAGLAALAAPSDTASLSVGAQQAAPPSVAPISVAAASIPVNETLKRVQNGLVVETPARSQLALLQTPQVFSRAALLAILDGAPASLDAPDAATLAVAAGLRVALFPGSPANIRVTTSSDLALAEALLNPRRAG